jgi:hypothetical protein
VLASPPTLLRQLHRYGLFALAAGWLGLGRATIWLEFYRWSCPDRANFDRSNESREPPASAAETLGGEMSDRQLHHMLDAKTQEIEAFMARILGLGDIDDLDLPTRQRHAANVRNMIEKHQESMRDVIARQEEAKAQGDITDPGATTLGRWPTRIGRLLDERYELAEQVLRSADGEPRA